MKQLTYLVIIIFTLKLTKTYGCGVPIFPSSGEINIAQTIDPCCYGSSKCNSTTRKFHYGKNFRLSEIKPDVMLSCVAPGIFHCTRCPAGLFFSEKCNACMENLQDAYNICPTTSTPVSSNTTPDEEYDKDFCKKEPYNGQLMGNLADPLNPHFYYACVNHVTYHMPCPTNLVYEASTDRCRYKQ